MPTDKTTQFKTKKSGRLYGIGIGPGDPELLTLKAYRLLSDTPVIFVPKKAEGGNSIAQSIISGLSPQINSKIVGIVMPMLRDKTKLLPYWQQAADVIWRYLSQGQDGVFVNIGDTLFYGTFIYIMEVLQSSYPEIEIEIVPGVSSVHAAAACSVVPLASDEDNMAVISGSQEDKIIRNALENFDTVVFMKVNAIFERLLAILDEMGLKNKSVYVRRCTTADEQIVRDIDCLKNKKLDYFSMLIVRK
jgi:precorrin-2/cobalt-factor-2 C20-methyltransferase